MELYLEPYVLSDTPLLHTSNWVMQWTWNLQKLSCKKLKDIWGDVMNSKKLNARDISELLGIEEPPEPNWRHYSERLDSFCSFSSPGCEDVDVGLGKQELLKAGIEALGGTWDDECASEGSTITATALARFGNLFGTTSERNERNLDINRERRLSTSRSKQFRFSIICSLFQ